MDEALGIESSNYNNIPDKINTSFGEIELYDKFGDFLPYIPSMDSPWKLSPSGWAINKGTGIKVKLEQKASPSYFQPNGCGDMTTTVTIKIPK